MHLQELGYEIRQARRALGLTQSQLAAAAHVTRPTLNQLENGVIRDLGIRKVNAILDELGLTLGVHQAPKADGRDFLRIASATASASFKTTLTEDELLRALLTGRIPANRRPHFRLLLEQSTPAILEGLVRQVAPWAKAGKVEKNLAKIVREMGSPESASP